MTIRLSSGLRSSMMFSYGFAELMKYGHIKLYAGAAQPVSADRAPTGQQIGFVSMDGKVPLTNQEVGGLEFDLVGPGRLGPVGNWVLRGTATGTIQWWRMVWNAADDGSNSEFYPRLDGAVGESLILISSQITDETENPIESFTLILPFQ